MQRNKTKNNNKKIKARMTVLYAYKLSVGGLEAFKVLLGSCSKASLGYMRAWL